MKLPPSACLNKLREITADSNFSKTVYVVLHCSVTLIALTNINELQNPAKKGAHLLGTVLYNSHKVSK